MLTVINEPCGRCKKPIPDDDGVARPRAGKPLVFFHRQCWRWKLQTAKRRRRERERERQR